MPLVNKGELAVIYSFLFLYFSFAGGGAFSIDGLLSREKYNAEQPPAVSY